MSRRPSRGWLGGTFDPIHEGHLDLARAAHAALGLDRITLVPANIPPHRPQPTASPAERVDMARLAAGATRWLDVTTFEVDASGPSYTAVTLDRLEAAGTDLRDLVLITGADAFAGIFSWHRISDILTRVTFAVVSRPGHSAARLPAHLPALAERMVTAAAAAATTAWRPCIVLIDTPTAAVSSTMVREAIRTGASLEGLVPDPVAEYIATHRLYSYSEGN